MSLLGHVCPEGFACVVVWPGCCIPPGLGVLPMALSPEVYEDAKKQQHDQHELIKRLMRLLILQHSGTNCFEFFVLGGLFQDHAIRSLRLFFKAFYARIDLSPE